MPTTLKKSSPMWNGVWLLQKYAGRGDGIKNAFIQREPIVKNPCKMFFVHEEHVKKSTYQAL